MTRALEGRTRVVGVTAAVAFLFGYYQLPVEATGWIFSALNLAGGGLILYGAHSMEPSRRRVWRTIGAGVVVYGLGNVLWFVYNLLLGADAQVVNTANIAYCAGYIILAVGIAMGVQRRDPGNLFTRLLDTAIIFAGTGVLWWVWLIHPALEAEGSIVSNINAALYPIGDLMLLAAIGGMILLPGVRRGSSNLLLAAMVSMVVSDAIYYYSSLLGDYSFGTYVDLPWLIGFFLFGAAGLQAKHETGEVHHQRSHNGMTGKRIALYIGTALVGPLALSFSSLRAETVAPEVVIVSSLVLFLLVLTRMVGLLREGEKKVAEVDRTSQRLKWSEERHRDVIDSLSEVIFQADLEARWSFLNSAWESLSGYTVEETLGEPCLHFCHPKDRAKLLDWFATLMQGKRESLRYEIRGRHKDGSIRWIEIFVRLKLDEAGNMTGTTGTLIDITERKNAERALAEAEEKYRTLVEQIPVVTYIDGIGPDGQNLYISNRIHELLGYSPEEWRERPDNWNRHLHPDDREWVMREHERAAIEHTPFAAEYRVVHRDGATVWVRDEASLVLTDDGEPAFWQGVVIDITERKELEEQLAHQAFHDPLTNLANRALFSDRVSHALARRSRNFDSEVAVLFVDLNEFKMVNDSLGHAVGDELLKAVAERLQGCLRLSDTAARFGGDEFAILVEDIESRDDAEMVGRRVVDAMKRPFLIAGHEIEAAAAIGIAVASEREKTVEDLMRNADLAMYMAKRDKNNMSIYEPDMHTAILGRLKLKGDLAAAIGTDQLRLHYQPVIDMRTGETVGTEALLRWDHPERGAVPPMEFIPIAEESDLINSLGEWVLREACAQAVVFAAACPNERFRSMTVNLSSRQLHDPEIVRVVSEALVESGLEPKQLVLEITETALMADVEESTAILQRLKDLGVRIAVDDFGTGYSSLSYLKRFPLDILKIDRSFIEGIDEGAEGPALASAVIRLAETLGLKTIAEGVETESQAQMLLTLGCRLAQGWLYSPAIEPKTLMESLAA